MNRDIFQYDTGEAPRFGDPLKLWRAFFVACGGDPEGWINATQDAQQPLRAAEYAERVIGATRQVFGLVPFDVATGKGATDHDAFTVLESFLDFLDQKKTAVGTSPTCTRPMAACP